MRKTKEASNLVERILATACYQLKARFYATKINYGLLKHQWRGMKLKIQPGIRKFSHHNIERKGLLQMGSHVFRGVCRLRKRLLLPIV